MNVQQIAYILKSNGWTLGCLGEKQKSIISLNPAYHYMERSGSDAEFQKEIEFLHGKMDREYGKICGSANGAYLDGWYSTEEKKYYFQPK